LSLREIKEPRINFGRDCCVKNFGVVIWHFSFLSNFLDYSFEAFYLGGDLLFGLLLTQTLPVNNNQLRSFLIDSHIVFGPIYKQRLIIGLREVVFARVASLAIAEDFGKVGIQRAYEG